MEQMEQMKRQKDRDRKKEIKRRQMMEEMNDDEELSMSQKKNRQKPVKPMEDEKLPKIQIVHFKSQDSNVGLIQEN